MSGSYIAIRKLTGGRGDTPLYIKSSIEELKPLLPFVMHLVVIMNVVV